MEIISRRVTLHEQKLREKQSSCESHEYHIQNVTHYNRYKQQPKLCGCYSQSPLCLQVDGDFYEENVEDHAEHQELDCHETRNLLLMDIDLLLA